MNPDNTLKQTIIRCTTMALLLVVALPGVAFAEGTFADIARKFAEEQMSVIPDLISAVCYISGVMLMAQGVMRLKDHADNPASAKLPPALGRLFVGGAVVTLPIATGFVVKTLGFGEGSTSAFQPFAVKLGG